MPPSWARWSRTRTTSCRCARGSAAAAWSTGWPGSSCRASAEAPMKILFLTHAFNGLAQRLFVELRALGHEVSIEIDVNDETTAQALALAKPDVVVAPFLKRAI